MTIASDNEGKVGWEVRLEGRCLPGWQLVGQESKLMHVWNVGHVIVLASIIISLPMRPRHMHTMAPHTSIHGPTALGLDC